MNNLKSKNTQIQKGKLLVEAIYKDNEIYSYKRKKGHINTAFFGLIMGGLAMGLCFIAIFFVDPNDLETIGWLIFLIIILFLFMLFNLLILKRVSLSRNEIYENGLSSSAHSYFEYRAGNTFHYFKDITMIGWGNGISRIHEVQNFKFIVIYKNNNYRHSTVYTDYNIANNFFYQLIEILKQKCPNAPWIQVDWKSLPLPK